MIDKLLRLARRAWLLAAVVVFWASPSVIWAQARGKASEKPSEPSFAFEYGLVLFVLLLGLAVVFRPSRRGDLEEEIELPFPK